MIRKSSDSRTEATRQILSFYVSLVRSSGDFPDRLWLTMEGRFQSSDALLAGDMYLFSASWQGVRCTVCRPIIARPFDPPGRLWKSRQVSSILQHRLRIYADIRPNQDYFEGLALCSQMRHPNLLPLIGVFTDPEEPLCFVHPPIPEVPRRFPFVHHIELSGEIPRVVCHSAFYTR